MSIYILLSLLSIAAQATEIKWTKGSSSSEAAEAPKSQRYWDEHGIERPDYAKTDAELAAERGESMHQPLRFYLFMAVLIGLGAFVYMRFVHLEGTRLGSNESNSKFPLHFHESQEAAAEKARKARLERFEASSAAKQD